MRPVSLSLLAAVALVMPASASAAASSTPSRLDGSCNFAGPIKPTPAIGVVPKSGPHFSFRGTGTCDGHLDGAAISARPVTVTFDNVETAFDTCEFGPDVNLPGKLTIGASQFDVTVDLARILLTGPLRVSTGGGGLGFGSASFQPGDAAAAPQQCVGARLTDASLTANFTTVAALVGQKAAATVTPRKPSGTSPAHSVRPTKGKHRRRPARHHAPRRHTIHHHRRAARKARPVDAV